jgi:hypothetical protein
MAFVPQLQRSKPRHRQVCALSLLEGGALMRRDGVRLAECEAR